MNVSLCLPSTSTGFISTSCSTTATVAAASQHPLWQQHHQLHHHSNINNILKALSRAAAAAPPPPPPAASEQHRLSFAAPAPAAVLSSTVPGAAIQCLYRSQRTMNVLLAASIFTGSSTTSSSSNSSSGLDPQVSPSQQNMAGMHQSSIPHCGLVVKSMWAVCREASDVRGWFNVCKLLGWLC